MSKLRIISGKYGGRNIEALSGSNTRPTTSRTREALFSMLSSRLDSFKGLCVLDAFAGSGALGIEALSRGAKKAVFYEKNRAAYKLLKSNVAQLNISEREATLICGDVLRSFDRGAISATNSGGDVCSNAQGGNGQQGGMPQASTKYDILFIDPPYAFDPCVVALLVNKLYECSFLSNKCLLCYEHSRDCSLEEFHSTIGDVWTPVLSRRYGTTMVSLFSLS